MRIKAVIAYDGSCFEGFQRQTRTARTVTGVIEDALRSLHIDAQIIGSGRTDAGVHATGQVIHFDLPPYWKDLPKLQRELNKKLTAIKFKHLSWAPDTFHARFDAKRRIYRYLFKHQTPTVFERNYVSHYPDFDPTILAAAQIVVAEDDVVAFALDRLDRLLAVSRHIDIGHRGGLQHISDHAAHVRKIVHYQDRFGLDVVPSEVDRSDPCFHLMDPPRP